MRGPPLHDGPFAGGAFRITFSLTEKNRGPIERLQGGSNPAHSLGVAWIDFASFRARLPARPMTTPGTVRKLPDRGAIVSSPLSVEADPSADRERIAAWMDPASCCYDKPEAALSCQGGLSTFWLAARSADISAHKKPVFKIPTS